MGRRKRKARSAATLSLAQIQKLLAAREQEVVNLTKRRETLLAALEEVDQALSAATGGSAPARRLKKKATRKKKVGRKKKATRKKKVGRKKKATRRKASAGKRGPRGESGLHQYIRRTLGKAQEPMKLAHLAAAVLKAGYKTTSGRFPVIVNQRLAEMKDVKRVGRGMYQLKG